MFVYKFESEGTGLRTRCFKMNETSMFGPLVVEMIELLRPTYVLRDKS